MLQADNSGSTVGCTGALSDISTRIIAMDMYGAVGVCTDFARHLEQGLGSVYLRDGKRRSSLQPMPPYFFFRRRTRHGVHIVAVSKFATSFQHIRNINYYLIEFSPELMQTIGMSDNPEILEPRQAKGSVLLKYENVELYITPKILNAVTDMPKSFPHMLQQRMIFPPVQIDMAEPLWELATRGVQIQGERFPRAAEALAEKLYAYGTTMQGYQVRIGSYSKHWQTAILELNGNLKKTCKLTGTILDGEETIDLNVPPEFTGLTSLPNTWRGVHHSASKYQCPKCKGYYTNEYVGQNKSCVFCESVAGTMCSVYPNIKANPLKAQKFTIPPDLGGMLLTNPYPLCDEAAVLDVYYNRDPETNKVAEKLYYAVTDCNICQGELALILEEGEYESLETIPFAKKPYVHNSRLHRCNVTGKMYGPDFIQQVDDEWISDEGIELRQEEIRRKMEQMKSLAASKSSKKGER